MASLTPSQFPIYWLLEMLKLLSASEYAIPTPTPVPKNNGQRLRLNNTNDVMIPTANPVVDFTSRFERNASY